MDGDRLRRSVGVVVIVGVWVVDANTVILWETHKLVSLFGIDKESHCFVLGLMVVDSK